MQLTRRETLLGFVAALFAPPVAKLLPASAKVVSAETFSPLSLNDIFKRVYASGLVNLAPSSSVLMQSIPWSKRPRR
jgi:hypothetical protein